MTAHAHRLLRGGLMAALALGTLTPSGPAAAKAAEPAGQELATYIVTLVEPPVIAYTGGAPGLAATAPGAGAKLDRNAEPVRGYVEHLAAAQARALDNAQVPAAARLASYAFAANGFAARLSAAQAAAIAAQPGVLAVEADSIQHVQTDSSGAFLGLTAPGAAYAAGVTGEGVVVGVIDTGIWPEHPSFADDGSYPALPAGAFTGTGCDFGNTAFNSADHAFACNRKLLAAKSYSAGILAGAPSGLAPGSYLSARDEDGHGTHTSSTAAGNTGVSASIMGSNLGTVSGIAPRARVSMYKACWSAAVEDQGGCATSDLVDAIDDAVADGVDVINYSIGSDTAAITSDAIALLNANRAGVFAAVSAGNAGPGAGTVGSPAAAPWVTAVGASTQTRDFRGTITLGNGQTFTGSTVTGGTGSLPLVDAADLGNVLCDPAVAFTGSISGKMVACKRGTVARVAKSQAVADAGGAAMLLYNAGVEDIMTDNHYVPSLHVRNTDGTAILAYIDTAGAGATASLSGGQKVDGQGNVMASFSSRGPNGASADIITPDVTAPGVNILAGNTPTALLGAPGQLFQAISGTSMSSPHVAGIYALVKQKYPAWTPAMAESALMTSARQDVVKETGTTAADPFDFGAGHVQPGGDVNRDGGLFDPGLVYAATYDDYVGFLCEADRRWISRATVTCKNLASGGHPTKAENLNLASIGISDIAGTATITRKVTNVSGAQATWSSSVVAPAGYTVTVTPSTLNLAAGATGTFTVKFTRTSATVGQWRFGSLTWTSANFAVRSPIAVKATS